MPGHFRTFEIFTISLIFVINMFLWQTETWFKNSSLIHNFPSKYHLFVLILRTFHWSISLITNESFLFKGYFFGVSGQRLIKRIRILVFKNILTQVRSYSHFCNHGLKFGHYIRLCHNLRIFSFFSIFPTQAKSQIHHASF